MTVAGVVELRRAVLAVCVLTDLDVRPDDTGVTLAGTPDLRLSWAECRAALPADTESPAARQRMAHWLWARRWAADLAPDELDERLRPVGLPVGHVLHLGQSWVLHRVAGGCLDLGLGAVGLDPAAPDGVVVLPPTALDRQQVRLAWPVACRYLADIGTLAADLLGRDGRAELRPVGDCDVVTLLGARALRSALAGPAGGMATAVVPMRRRGWTRLSLLDPAFGPAAAAATDPVDRGFARPLLITVDALTMVAAGGRPEQLALRQDVPDGAWARDVLYR